MTRHSDLEKALRKIIYIEVENSFKNAKTVNIRDVISRVTKTYSKKTGIAIKESEIINALLWCYAVGIHFEVASEKTVSPKTKVEIREATNAEMFFQNIEKALEFSYKGILNNNMYKDPSFKESYGKTAVEAIVEKVLGDISSNIKDLDEKGLITILLYKYITNTYSKILADPDKIRIKQIKK